MASQRPRYDTVVVGAGLIGLAAAWRLAGRGMSVCVVEREATGAGSSGVAAGMLAPVTEADFGEQDLIAANLAAAREYENFVAELEAQTGMHTGYRPSGTLVVATDRDELESVERLHRLQQSLGLEASLLGSRELRSLEPALSPRTAGGLEVPGDHQVRPRALLAALESAASIAGVERRSGTVVEVLRRAGLVEGVLLEDRSELLAPRVVVAAGAWSGSIGGVDHQFELRPVKGQILRLHGDPLIARVLRSPEVYAVPRSDGTIVLGATVEERGFDTAVTAGGVLELLRRGYDLLPGIAELELKETSAGLRPTTPDNRPVVGALGPAGLIVATGHWRNGVLLAPLTAEAVVDLIDGREMRSELAAFGPRRARSKVEQ